MYYYYYYISIFFYCLLCNIMLYIDDYISDQGMLYFNEYSRYIPFLTRLDLKSNFITDLGVRYICECLSHISSLQYLRLDGIYLYIYI